MLAAFSHGTSSPIGQQVVSALMERVAAQRPDLEVRLGYVDVQQPDVAATLAAAPADSAVTVVPLLLSAGYHVHVDLANAVHAHTASPTVLTGALGPDERLTALLVRRLRELGLQPDDTLVLAVAGSSDIRAVDDCREVSRQLSEALGRDVILGFLSAAHPRLPEAIATARAVRPGTRVVVSTYLLAPGYFFDLTAAAAPDAIAEPLLTLADPAPAELVDVVIDRYDSAWNASPEAKKSPSYAVLPPVMPRYEKLAAANSVTNLPVLREERARVD